MSRNEEYRAICERITALIGMNEPMSVYVWQELNGIENDLIGFGADYLG